MRKILGVVLMVFLSSCGERNGLLIDSSTNEHRDVTKNISLKEFNRIKSFVLENGDTRTYSNRFSNNPHYSFKAIKAFEVFLNPEIGQANINCDPKISDFNEIVIRDRDMDQRLRYIPIIRVKQGDIKNRMISVPDGLREGAVYLRNHRNNDLDELEKVLNAYIALIRYEIIKKDLY